MFEIAAEHDGKKYIMTINRGFLTLKVKRMFFTKQVGVFSLREFASNAFFIDDTMEIRYGDFLFKIPERESYEMLKNVIDDLLRKQEEKEKVEKQINLIRSRIMPALSEILRLRLWYSVYVEYANNISYVDAAYNLPDAVAEERDPLDIYMELRRRLSEKTGDFVRLLESLTQECRDDILRILEEGVSKQDSLLDTYSYDKISEAADELEGFIEDSISKLIERISTSTDFSRRQQVHEENSKEKS